MAWNIAEKQDAIFMKMNSNPAGVMNDGFFADLDFAFSALKKPRPSKPVIISSGAKMFSPGFDLEQCVPLFKRGRRAEINRWFENFLGAMLTVFEHPAPVAAAIEGHAIAGGCVLALCCDVRVAQKGGGKTKSQVGQNAEREIRAAKKGGSKIAETSSSEAKDDVRAAQKEDSKILTQNRINPSRDVYAAKKKDSKTMSLSSEGSSTDVRAAKKKDNKTLIGLNEISIGFPMPACLDTFVTAVAGEKLGREMIDGGRLYSVEEAAEIGIIQKISQDQSCVSVALSEIGRTDFIKRKKLRSGQISEHVRKIFTTDDSKNLAAKLSSAETVGKLEDLLESLKKRK